MIVIDAGVLVVSNGNLTRRLSVSSLTSAHSLTSISDEVKSTFRGCVTQHR
jgi:hypothetical protein